MLVWLFLIGTQKDIFNAIALGDWRFQGWKRMHCQHSSVIRLAWRLHYKAHVALPKNNIFIEMRWKIFHYLLIHMSVCTFFYRTQTDILRKNQTTLPPIDFDVLDHWVISPNMFLCVSRKGLNDMRMNEWWQDFYFRVKYPFKSHSKRSHGFRRVYASTQTR